MAGTKDDIGNVEEKKVDASFKNLPSAISEMANATWDNFQEDMYARF